MKEILSRYQVDPAFLPILFSFGDAPHLAESGATNVATNKSKDRQNSKLLSGDHPKVIHLTDSQIFHTNCNISKRITGPFKDHGRYGTPVYTTITLQKTSSISSFSSILWMKASLKNSLQLMLSLTSPNICSRRFVPNQCNCMSCHLQRMYTIGDGV